MCTARDETSKFAARDSLSGVMNQLSAVAFKEMQQDEQHWPHVTDPVADLGLQRRIIEYSAVEGEDFSNDEFREMLCELLNDM